MTDLNKLNATTQSRKMEEAAKAGWHFYTEYHWGKIVNGKRLDYWPSKSKFQYEGVVMQGDVDKFIAGLLSDESKTAVVPTACSTASSAVNFTVIQALSTLKTEVLGLESPSYAIQLIERIEAEQKLPAVAVPDEIPRDDYADPESKAHRRGWNDCREEMLRNIATPSPRITEHDARDAIKEIFLANGFTIKDGQTDLKPYVYDAAFALLDKLNNASIGYWRF